MGSGIGWVALGVPLVLGGQEAVYAPKESAPPPNPPIVERLDVETRPADAVSRRTIGTAAYEIGPVTGEEQLYIELINRARLDPFQEGLWLTTLTDENVASAVDFFETDLELVLSDPEYGFAVLDWAQPLAPNALLRDAATAHTQSQFEYTFQGHTDQNGASVGERVTDAGYAFRNVGENVYSSARSIIHGHAGFQIDWGVGPGGIQDPPGHRNSIHNGNFREIGVGVILGSKDEIPTDNEHIAGLTRDVGPQLVTQVFGLQIQNANPLITGVAYYDLNGNSFYDPGEGLEGLQVAVMGASFYGVTAPSGGFSTPVDTDQTYEVRFISNGVVGKTAFVEIEDGYNAKVDFAEPYSGPELAGPQIASAQAPNSYTVSSVFGAESYEWSVDERGGETVVEGFENGIDEFDTTGLSDYDAWVSGWTESGDYALRLTHTADDSPKSQFIKWNRSFSLTEGAKLEFYSLMGRSTATQIPQIEIRTVGMGPWQVLWERTGETSQERRFSRVEVDLADYIGSEVEFRFGYRLLPGSYFPGTATIYGWWIDDIALSGVSFPEIATVEGNTFEWTAPATGEYVLRARPRIAGRAFPYGPDFIATGQDLPPEPAELAIAKLEASQPGELTLRVATNLQSADDFLVEVAPTVRGPWTEQAPSAVDTLEPGGFTLTMDLASPDVSAVFLRLRER